MKKNKSHEQRQLVYVFSAVQIYDFHVFLSHLLHLRVYNELTIDQLPVGLIAQLVRALHRYRRGHGFDSRSGLNFFQALFLNCLSWVYTAMIFICLKQLV